ncbi:MAG: NFACT RNA binding domain-containing protein [Lachnospiraceae bacterium]|jgi:predicted ribosome quality control (RQC) complex YloA/Tae2 family protein|nr:NFACT RNA binding domain-containing protein [Lachnospiraceae bacterium]
MAFDGIVVANLAHELRDKLTGARIQKIAQPEKDELLITLKGGKDTYKLLISANGGLPLVYLTGANKPSPLTAPNFCMLLRKHIGSGKVVGITQPSLERIISFHIEHLDEMGDLRQKTLTVELMGKHSNIIFLDESGTVIDAIKHIGAHVSSVREVLPGRAYFIPNTAGKVNPLTMMPEQQPVAASCHPAHHPFPPSADAAVASATCDIAAAGSTSAPASTPADSGSASAPGTTPAAAGSTSAPGTTPADAGSTSAPGTTPADAGSPSAPGTTPADAGSASSASSTTGTGGRTLPALLSHQGASVQKALYTTFTGISPICAEEICHRAGVDSDTSAKELTDAQWSRLSNAFAGLMVDVAAGHFAPHIIYEGETPVDSPSIPPSGTQPAMPQMPVGHLSPAEFSSIPPTATQPATSQMPVGNLFPVEFSSIPLTCMEGGKYHAVPFASISTLLETYYATRAASARAKQKSSDLRKVVSTSLEREARKLQLQENQLKDTEKRDKYRIYGELLNTYGHGLAGGESTFTCPNHYTGQDVTIPLDPTLTASANAKKYFDRYGKLKRTYEATLGLLEETRRAIDHLESIGVALDIARTENDLAQIKEELVLCGFIKRKGGHATSGQGGAKSAGAKSAGAKSAPKSPKQPASKPLHYISSDGFHMYVGKNNLQNEEITFRLADGDDWWFHAKGIPGSHVIVKTGGRELPDRAFEEAGALAAYYSKGRDWDKVEIDYIQRKHVKKAAGSAPGFVIYHTNYSLVAAPKSDFQEVR